VDTRPQNAEIEEYSDFYFDWKYSSRCPFILRLTNLYQNLIISLDIAPKSYYLANPFSGTKQIHPSEIPAHIAVKDQKRIQTLIDSILPRSVSLKYEIAIGTPSHDIERADVSDYQKLPENEREMIKAHISNRTKEEQDRINREIECVNERIKRQKRENAELEMDNLKLQKKIEIRRLHTTLLKLKHTKGEPIDLISGLERIRDSDSPDFERYVRQDLKKYLEISTEALDIVEKKIEKMKELNF
jgi:hypothetical protein